MSFSDLDAARKGMVVLFAVWMIFIGGYQFLMYQRGWVTMDPPLISIGLHIVLYGGSAILVYKFGVPLYRDYKTLSESEE